ncbi:DUF6932 family protein [Acinetobacter nosocomialis]|uniref:Nucleotidyltransferase n=1 Tax=Acinetobacter nosocomialis TaxID=106654 RepID=A0AB36M5D7_ACINO|nr:hypothetical protein [Acinetobacter nosocomialis]MDC5255326.1 hypothetical protein [Acinetobacter baumannii]OTM00189.1 hypothetical protein B9X58_04135 [Acinetobacter nosocomialis]
MIPEFNMAGVIPPIRPEQPGYSPDRSPYIADIESVVTRFGTTQARINILRGFLAYRKCFYDLGVTEGFQWINGSFCQDIENIEHRDPGDIDVVTFYYIPKFEKGPDQIFIDSFFRLLDTDYTKPHFKVDAYGMQLGTTFLPATIKQLSYWYSMWSHRKSDNMWKGFIQVSLSPEADEQAIIALNQIKIKEDNQ